MDKSRFYRSIPKVDILLEDDRIQEAIARFDRDTVMDAVREQTEFVREQIRTLDEENTLCILVDGLIPEIIRRVEKMHTPDMRPGKRMSRLWWKDRDICRWIRLLQI